MKKSKFYFIFLLFWIVESFVPVEAQRTYCNPLNLDYGCGGLDNPFTYREAADPVIVLFNNKYYLFTTRDRGGYRMSDDLIHWENIYFSENILQTTAFTEGRQYVAPAVAADDNYIYFFNFNTQKSPADIIRSSDPASGKWEKCGQIRVVADPHLFIDNGRYWVYHGLGKNANCFELDPKTMTEIKQSEVLIRLAITDMSTCAGYHFGQSELSRELEAGKKKYNFVKAPCPEGSWVVKHDGKYYFQYATPGTASQWYCDVVMTSDNPQGPFVEQPYNPVSLNAGDFMGSAGHSCVFQDKYGNWWQASTMWVGKYTGFERRIGLFPVKFDKERRMKVYTRMGEYPMVIPQKKFDPDQQYLAGWNLLSLRKKCTASSSLPRQTPDQASDENIRTWWSAKTGNPGEWFQMDLGAMKTVRAVQLNFTEQDMKRSDEVADDYNAYKLYTSQDGKTWTLEIDKSKNKKGNTHDYIELNIPKKIRYIKVENIHSPKGGKFALSDLRVFGKGNGKRPVISKNITAERDKKDARYSTVIWEKAKNADGYIVQFGYRPDYLNQSIMVKDGDKTSLDIHILIPGQKYYYRVDAYNENGVTQGRRIVAD